MTTTRSHRRRDERALLAHYKSRSTEEDEEEESHTSESVVSVEQASARGLRRLLRRGRKRAEEKESFHDAVESMGSRKASWEVIEEVEETTREKDRSSSRMGRRVSRSISRERKTTARLQVSEKDRKKRSFSLGRRKPQRRDPPEGEHLLADDQRRKARLQQQQQQQQQLRSDVSYTSSRADSTANKSTRSLQSQIYASRSESPGKAAAGDHWLSAAEEKKLDETVAEIMRSGRSHATSASRQQERATPTSSMTESTTDEELSAQPSGTQPRHHHLVSKYSAGSTDRHRGVAYVDPLQKKEEDSSNHSSQIHSARSSNSSVSKTDSQQTPVRTGKPVDVVKAALSRPFGRSSATRKWVVEVSSAEWDADEERWKYRILVQRRQFVDETDYQQESRDLQPHASFTAAFTWRSVADFLWLEQALRREFQGALLVPVLSFALGRPVEMAQGMPVEADRLRNWLSDILNGVRGGGELVLDVDSAAESSQGGWSMDLLKSESMETFLYRNSVRPLAIENEEDELCREKPRRSPSSSGGCCRDGEPADQSLVHSILSKAQELCVGPEPSRAITCHRATTPLQKEVFRNKLPVDVLNCSSRALGAARSSDVQESVVDTSAFASPRGSSALAIHSELLEAENELVLNYRKTALRVMEKLQTLQQEEDKIGAAWKRFAVSLSNLFAYEKDVESARIADSKVKREHMPYRKVSKSAVDDSLRILARSKQDRAAPALLALKTMLAAYLADLSAVEPSVGAYSRAISKLSEMKMELEDLRLPSSRHSSTKDMSSKSWEELKEWTMKSLQKNDLLKKNSAESSSPKEELDLAHQLAALQQEQIEYRQRVVANERLLQKSLTTMCRATPFRAARMAWRYWHTESTQCNSLNSAASALLTKMDVVNEDSVTNMVKRHAEEEKTDASAELELIQRIVYIGSRKKFGAAQDEGSTIDGETHVEVDNDSLSEGREKALLRDKALDVARHRIGRWDSTLAVAIMEAVEVDDPNVRVEETTKDLRLVRKFVIGLRENLDRCVEALRLLQEAITGTQESKDVKISQKALPKEHISSRRKDFLVELSKLFSGKFVESRDVTKRHSASRRVLAKAGIDTTNDAFGWYATATAAERGATTTSRQASVGELAFAYATARDSRMEWLLSTLTGLLDEYYQRIETIEGFVYMECVGIQLEKHFSQKRAKALSAFEKKADITTAINMARKKRMPELLTELNRKLQKLGPDVTHTAVKETKDAHLESKALKAELHELALKRLMRARESSTERVITLATFWAKEEIKATTKEKKALGEAMACLERSVGKEDVEAVVAY